MTLFQTIQIVIFSYVAVCVCMAIFIAYFPIKYGSRKGRYEMNGTLEKLRGKKTILLPFTIFSWIFLLCWFSLALPFIDFVLHLGYLSTYENGTFSTWVGSFKGEEGNYYFLTLFIGILGSKGFIVISYISGVLSDKTLAVKKSGRMGYKKEL